MFVFGEIAGGILGALVGGLSATLHSCTNGACLFDVPHITSEALKYAFVGVIGIGIAFGLFLQGRVKTKSTFPEPLNEAGKKGVAEYLKKLGQMER